MVIQMPYHRTTDDADHSFTHLAGEIAFKRPPPWSNPWSGYELLNIDNFANGVGNLPDESDSQKPCKNYLLFSSEEQLQQLTNFTNA